MVADLDDPERLGQINNLCKKFNLARKMCLEKSCLAYTQSLLGTDGDFLVTEILDITRAASRCRKA